MASTTGEPGSAVTQRVERARAEGLDAQPHYVSARRCWVVKVTWTWLSDVPVLLVDDTDLNYLLAELSAAERAALIKAMRERVWPTAA